MQWNIKGLVKTGQSRERKKYLLFPLSNKWDLILADIHLVTDYLIKDNTLSSNCKLIHKAQISLLSVTFDIVYYLSQNRKKNYLKLRFVYIHLMYLINALEAVIIGDLAYSKACQKPAFDVDRATSRVAIRVYLNIKENTLEIILLKTQLLEYIYISKYWS